MRSPDVIVWRSVNHKRSDNLFQRLYAYVTSVGSPANRSISVSDTITVSESRTVLLPQLKPSVSDSIAVSEARTILIPTLHISRSDLITVTDFSSVAFEGIIIVQAQEQIAVSEAHTLFFPAIVIQVGDSITVSEVQTLLFGTLNLSANDSITLLEALSVGSSIIQAVLSDITIEPYLEIDSITINDMSKFIYVGNDGLLKVRGLRNADGGAFLNAATVSVEVKDSATGALVSGQTWPLTLSSTGSEGTYIGVLEDGLSLTPNKQYIVEVTANAGSDLIGFWKKYFSAKYRG